MRRETQPRESFVASMHAPAGLTRHFTARVPMLQSEISVRSAIQLQFIRAADCVPELDSQPDRGRARGLAVIRGLPQPRHSPRGTERPTGPVALSRTSGTGWSSGRGMVCRAEDARNEAN